MPDRYFQHTFANGLTFLVEQMPGVQSAAMTLLLPAGGSTDPAGQSGSATVLADLVLRGAGERDNRTLTEHLDGLGLQRSSGVGVHHTRFGCAAIAANVIAGLDAFADIVRRPMMPNDGLIAGKDLAVQSLAGIEDEPSRKLMVELRRLYLPSPYGRNSMGEIADIEKLTLADMRSDFANRYGPNDAILAIAGNVDAAELKPIIEKLFGDWQMDAPLAVELTPSHERYKFFEQDAEQTYIGLAYPSVPETHEDYYAARVAAEVLGGGMSGRLFTEVREKRALCYSVGASYGSLKGMGSIFASAGTSNERAQATLDCLTGEIVRLGEGITAAELDRAKIGLKSGTIMSGESTSARAGTIAHDFFMRGRLRGLDEIKSAIDSLTLEQVNAYLKRSTPRQWTTVIVGPKELNR